MQTMQQTLTEERDKVLLHSTKSEEQRLRTKLTEAEEVCWFAFSVSIYLSKCLPRLRHQSFFESGYGGG